MKNGEDLYGVLGASLQHVEDIVMPRTLPVLRTDNTYA